MKRTVKTVENQTYIIEEFDSYNELLKTNDSREWNFGNYGGARERTDNDFCGATWEEAVEMLRYGWEDKEKIKAVSDTVSKLEKMQDIQKLSFRNDVVGYAPIVPLALKGVPQNMINTVKKPKKAKVINMIIETGVLGDVSVNEKLEWGAKVVAGIIALEKQGFRVKIECMKVISMDNWYDKVHAMRVLIKDEKQPLDIKRIMFPIAHAAMQRRIMWDWYERLPGAQRFCGNGVSIYAHSEEHQKVVKKNVADTENSYVICYGEDINEILKGVA